MHHHEKTLAGALPAPTSPRPPRGLRFALLLSGLLAALVLSPVPHGWADLSPEPEKPKAQSTSQEQAQEWFRKGTELLERNDLPGAIAAYRKAVALHDTFAEAYNNLGYALRLRGEYQPAVQAYRRALALRPNFPEAHEYLGMAYLELGMLAEARQELDALRKLGSALAQELEQAIQKRQAQRAN